MRTARLVLALLVALVAFPAVAASKPVHRNDEVAQAAPAKPAALKADPGVDPAPATTTATSDIPARDDFCFRLSENWTLHPIASLSVLAFDMTNRSFLGELSIAGLYEARYKDTIGFALGLGFQSGPVKGITATGLVTLPYHLAAGVQYQWLGDTKALSLIAAPTFRF